MGQRVYARRGNNWRAFYLPRNRPGLAQGRAGRQQFKVTLTKQTPQLISGRDLLCWDNCCRFCLISIGLLLLSRHEREEFPPLRFLIRLMFPKLEFHDRNRRVSLFSGVLLAIFAFSTFIALALTLLEKRL